MIDLDKQIMQENLTDGQIDWNDRATMQYLFRRFYLPLRSFAYQHVKDDSITDDFVQNAFLNLWERRMNFNAVLAVKSFLYLNVRNACLNYLKREQVRIRHEGHVIRMLTEEDCADIALEEEVNRLVYDAVAALPEQSRRVVLLTMEGVPNPEIAERLNISTNTVKTLKMRAYRMLRERLKGIQWMLLLPFFMK